jgi:hypothetical protein
MYTPSGDCVSCRKFHDELYRAKVRVRPDRVPLTDQFDRVWVCRECRGLPTAKLIENVQDTYADVEAWLALDTPDRWDRNIIVVTPTLSDRESLALLEEQFDGE